ncbi:MAG: AgmX/PglI C-terminal domain-containing protein, partial [Deltaproteobacteria bacterium]|nr:AgmX/PglI C-terminal domain-containing protein [Deltaproteobacteria bacterium]
IERRRRPRERDARRLAAMLLAKADAVAAGEGGAQRAEALRLDARKLLRKLPAGKNKRLAAKTIELHAYAEARTGKYGRALKALARLQNRSETSPFALGVEVTARLLDPNAEVPDSLLNAVLPADAGPLLPYARAWLRLRRGDVRSAYLDLSKAIALWGDGAPESVREEATSLAAMAGVSADDVASALAVEEANQGALRASLGRAYQRVGEYRLAAELDSGGEQQGAAGAERMRHLSDLAYQMGEPEDAARHLIRATELAAGCREACSELAEALSKRALDMARFFHTVYATTQDPSYFEPARSLYARLQATGGNREVDQLVRDLVRHKVGADPGAGIHTKEVLVPFAAARASAVKSCYSLELARSPTLGGLLEMRWAIDSSGEVKGASSQPAAGEEGLAAVAKCALEHSRSWKFPGRFVRGQTRLTVRFELSRDVE